MVGHCCENYWLNILQKIFYVDSTGKSFGINIKDSNNFVPIDVWNDYVNGIHRKTICECKNKNQLAKAEQIAKELGLVKNIDFGYVNDPCFTDLTPENEDGTCTVGIWFKPLPDEIAHKISKKFQLYRDEHHVV